MANRHQNHQPGSQRYANYRPSDEDDNRSARDYERDYGQHAESYEEGRWQQGRRRDFGQENESSGRSGSYAGYGDFGQGDYNQSARGRYGQGGYGQSQPNYGQEFGSSGTSNYGSSTYGSGRGSSMGSQRGYGGYGGEGSYGSQGWSSQGGWREPYGEGQQYGSPGGYSQGMHRGKGPKNFQRSDERVKELLCERLHDDPDIDASEVTVTVQGGRIMLEGTVDSRRTKNAIEDVAEQIGMQDVQNNLRVQKTGERGMESAGRSPAGRTSQGSDEGEQSKQKRN
ncbi:MAG TPA: BON domain-containing protein [Steroidobacteraceae bacterium]|nr:BON domain-containing protein [Steroidobacteraceae bacterium]